MAALKALQDGEEKDLVCLGEMRGVKGVPARELRIKKPVNIPGAGSYRKDFSAPLYSRRVMEELSKKDEGCGPCIGLLAGKGGRAQGYVRRQLGAHLLCLPVYSQKDFSTMGWKVRGYLPAGEGYLKVVQRRVAYWVCLAILAVLVFTLSYFAFRYGPEVLWNTILDLPETLADEWYRILREWGVV